MMLQRLIRLAVSTGVIVLVLAVSDLADLGARLRGADLRWLGACVAGLGAITCLSALRWRWVARDLGLPLPYARSLREYFFATLVNQVVPGGIAGDVARTMRVTQPGDLRRAAQSVVIERATGQIATLMPMVLGLTASLAVPGGIAWPWWTGGALACLALLFCAACIVQSGRDDPDRRSFFAPLWTTVRTRRQIALAVLIAFLLNFSFYASARAVGTILPPAAYFTVIPLVLTSMMIPMSVGGWGWREGAAAALFPLAGATAAQGIAAGIAYGACMLVAALPALAFLVRSPAADPIIKPS
ncbi:lysylphosphatidylglycerol synthase transmembrane domain-containing protein [Sedimentitalea todarodis]|uniref:Lysylphosphatidylglycerol synthase transmembrane domain-containing protein n=1 Tax=Sedimentitalea todarodis TaxID=1631240 RepID=A0ABU3VDX3_9RHOB|nr:lysylphosphatidylglycerol synthase transmembrane domain-containing protein [Sedimentitalea todarodis]MDU9004372.1 lysylphosphatidylglycerol synthase transmembrane domain-containing protein [Sedimentitalea todarodis]